MAACRICGNVEKNHVFDVKEMLRGTRAIFQYMECNSCKCVQIISIPKDMSSYYDNDVYGSFSSRKKDLVSEALRQLRNKYAIRKKGGLLGSVLSWVKPLPRDFTIVGEYADKDSQILDVGCGAGDYVDDLVKIGYRNASGIDPFIGKDLVLESGGSVTKSYIEDVKGTYDIVLSHHSLEHVPNPLNTLVGIRKALTVGGVCILTVPVAENLYRKYGSNCYLIQAPQHFYLFSIESIRILAQKAGFSIESVIREIDTNFAWHVTSSLWEQDIASNEFQGTGIQLLNYDVRDELSREFERLKQNDRGDNVIFILKS